MCSLVLNHDVLYLLGTPVSNKEWCILVLTVYIYFVNVQINTAIPASTKLKALQLLNVCDRAEEEMGRATDDITATMTFVTKRHCQLSAAVNTDSTVCVRARLLQQAAMLDQYASELWQVAQKHLDASILLTLPQPTHVSASDDLSIDSHDTSSSNDSDIDQ